MMGRFADAHVLGFADEELNQYEEILSYSDPDLYNWISGREETPANLVSPVMEKLLNYSFSLAQ